MGSSQRGDAAKLAGDELAVYQKFADASVDTMEIKLAMSNHE